MIKVNRITELVYNLLNEYDIDVWEDISYIELADFWVNMIEETSKENIDINTLEAKREMLLQEYLFKGE